MAKKKNHKHKDGIVSVWIVDLDNEKEFNRFVDRSRSKSRFEKALDFPGWYTHWWGFHAKQASVLELIIDCYASSSYASAAEKAAKSKKIGKAYGVIATTDVEFYPDVQEVEPPLRFLGSFPYDDNAPSLAEQQGKAKPEIEDHSGIVSVWLGSVENAKELRDYMKEQYRDEDAPISEFAGEFCLWYDHDFVESSVSRKKEPTVADLLKGHSYADSFCETLIAAAKKKRVKDANAIVVIYDFAFDPKKPVCSESAHRVEGKLARNTRLKFIGALPYEK